MPRVGLASNHKASKGLFEPSSQVERRAVHLACMSELFIKALDPGVKVFAFPDQGARLLWQGFHCCRLAWCGGRKGIGRALR